MLAGHLQRANIDLNGVVLVTSTAYIALNLLADIAYAYIDPRIHYR